MLKVTSAEFQKNFGRYQDMAIREPVAITRNGRDRTVLLSTEEYERLKRRDRRVMTLADFTEEEIKALEEVEIPEEAAQFDHEMG